MSKYEPLRAYLNSAGASCVPMSFDEIEKVIGFRLPPVANGNRAWWSNNPSNNVMTKMWLAAGYKTEQVNMEGRRLVFRREAESPNLDGGAGAPAGGGQAAMFGWLKGTVRFAPGDDLTKPMDEEWGRDRS